MASALDSWGAFYIHRHHGHIYSIGKKMKSLQNWTEEKNHTAESKLPSEQEDVVKQMHKTVNVIHVLSVLLFTLMILKPVIF